MRTWAAPTGRIGAGWGCRSWHHRCWVVFLLLFANSFSAYATAAALTDSSRIVSLRLAFFLGGDVNAGEDAVGFSLASWMIIIMAIAMGLYWVLRKRAERWQES